MDSAIGTHTIIEIGLLVALVLFLLDPAKIFSSRNGIAKIFRAFVNSFEWIYDSIFRRRDAYAPSIYRQLKRLGLLPADELPHPPNKLTVSLLDDYGETLRDMQALAAKILLPAIRSDILIKRCNGHSQAPVSDGSFRILLHSSPSGFAELAPPDQSFGYYLPQDKVFAPSTHGLPLHDESGFVIGELLDSNLYLHCSLEQDGSKAEAMFIGRFFAAARTALATFSRLTVEELNARIEQEMSRQCLLQLASPDSVPAPNAIELADVEQQYRQQFLRTVAAQRDNLRLSVSPESELGREFDALFRIPKVTGVEADGNYLIVSTVPLNCVDPRTGLLHRIGTFKIHMTLAGGSIYWLNTSRKNEYEAHAPHVNASGHACLGNTEEMFRVLIARRDFPAAVEAAIAFVESVNVDDNWGSKINNWPLVSEVEKTK